MTDPVTHIVLVMGMLLTSPCVPVGGVSCVPSTPKFVEMYEFNSSAPDYIKCQTDAAELQAAGRKLVEVSKKLKSRVVEHVVPFPDDLGVDCRLVVRVKSAVQELCEKVKNKEPLTLPERQEARRTACEFVKPWKYPAEQEK